MFTIDILINLFFGVYIVINKYIPSPFIQIINNDIFKIIILFIMIVINKPILSLLIGISYILTIQNINCSCNTKNSKEKFGNCSCELKIKEKE